MTLQVNNVTLKIDETTLIDNLQFEVNPGDIITIMGASGCGKSSILNFISGTLSNTFQRSGHVILDGTDVTNKPVYQRHIGLQFQDHILFPHMTVGENLAFALSKRYDNNERINKIETALIESGMEGFANYNPAALSGGQKARISLMRTLLSEPAALLMDEPFSKLDIALKKNFRQFVFNQITTRNIPAIMVTHDQDDTPEGAKLIYI